MSGGSYKQLDWEHILNHLQAFATSNKAKQELRELSPLPDPEKAKNQMQAILNAQSILQQQQVRPFFESLDHVSPWLLRLKKGATLKGIELKDVRWFCLELLALRSILPPEANETDLFSPDPLISTLEQVIHPSGDIRSDASQTLYQLIKEKESISQKVTQIMDRLVKDFQIQDYLQDKYVTTREGRWVIPVKSGKQHSIKGVIHGASQTKQTVYIEPDATIHLNNRLREIEVAIEEEVERILQTTSRFLMNYCEAMDKAAARMLEYDILFAQAQWNQRIGGNIPDWTHEELELEDLAHPLMIFDGKKPVRNSIRLKEKKVLLLSGPNAGGKTVLLKAIGLACHMARCGLPVPARQPRLPFFENILVAIGDQQSVGEELSTFAAHLKLLQQAAQLKGGKNLILVDEIASSTDPEEGGAIARAFIERFVANGVFGVITSHLSFLKTGWGPHDGVLPGSLEFDLKTANPTYHFLSGVSGQSLALEMAKKMRVDSSIIERAYELLSPASKQRLQLLSEAEGLKQQLIEQQESLKAARDAARAEKETWERKNKEFEAQKEKELERIIKQAQKQVDELLATLKAADTLTRHRRAAEAKTQLPQLIKSGNSSSASREAAPLTAETFKQKFPPGSKVFIRSMNRDGIVQSEPNSKGEIMVLADSMRLSVPWTEVEISNQAGNPTQGILRSKGYFFAQPDQDIVLDCRGQTVEQALERLDMVLDQALQMKKNRFKVVHGHGTEVLKKTIRTHLTRSPFVLKWTAGRPEEGGDGITWVDLDT
jgi:DNA mismatch repair protein MutS2